MQILNTQEEKCKLKRILFIRLARIEEWKYQALASIQIIVLSYTFSGSYKIGEITLENRLTVYHNKLYISSDSAILLLRNYSKGIVRDESQNVHSRSYFFVMVMKFCNLIVQQYIILWYHNILNMYLKEWHKLLCTYTYPNLNSTGI